MASRKLSEHTELLGVNVNPSAYFIEILDVSDTTDASSGTNKKIKPSELKVAIDLENIDNTSDANKPVSTAQQTALDNKVDKVTGKGLSTNDYDNTEKALVASALQSISGIVAGGELSGTYPNPAVLNSAVLAKVLTGLNISGSTISATDTILQAFGKIQSQLNGVLGGAIYQSTWNASTNSPSLASGTGTKGYYYVVSVAGSTNLDSTTDWKVGDWAIFNGTIWQKVDNTDAVSSVNGYTGAVSLTSADISEVTNLYFTNARAIASVLTGYSSGAGVISATDTILTAIQKLNGNISAISSSGGTEVISATITSNQNDYAISGMSTSKNVMTIFKVTASNSFKFTGISATSVEDGKRVRIFNNTDRLTGAARIIIMEGQHSASGSSAANRLQNPYFNGMPVIITPESYVEYTYNSVDSFWHFSGGSEYLAPNGFFDSYSDCHANAPFIPTTATAGTVGTTSSGDLSNTSQKTVGTMTHTITTNAGRAYLGTQANAFYFGSYSALCLVRVHPIALADATDDYVLYAGFTDFHGGTLTDQATWVYNRSQSTDWRTSTASNTTETINTVTGFTPSTTAYHTLGVFVNGDGSNVDFFYSTDNDTWNFATSHTTNIPTGTSRLTGFASGFTKTAGSGSKTMGTDWLGFKLLMKRGV